MKRIVVISTGSPTKLRPYFMPFVYEQVETLAKKKDIFVDVFVLLPVFHYLSVKYWKQYIHLRFERPIPSELANCKYHSVWYFSRPQVIGGFDFVNWQVVKLIRRRIRRLQIFPDVIHGHFGVIGPACEKLSADLGVDFVLTEHSSDLRPVIEKIGIESLRSSYEKARKVICVSEKLETSIRDLFPSLQNLVVHTNGISFEKFIVKKGFSQSNRLVFIGHLIERKGIKVLLEACLLLSKERVNFHLDIYGVGLLQKHIENFILINNLDRNISIKGFFHNSKVNAILLENDVLVLPSNKESFGVVVIEALATGIPVVATECGGPETIIINEKLGEIVKPDDPIELKNAITKVLTNLSNYNSNEIRRFAEQKYCWNEIVDKLIVLYGVDS